MRFATKAIEQVTETLIDYRGKTPRKTASGVKLITAKVIKEGFITRGEHEFIAEDDYDTWMRRGLPRQWDILITTEAPLGEVAQVRTPERIALAQRVILLRGKPSVVDQGYYYYALQSPYVQGQLRARSTGTTVLGIKQSELRQVLVPLYSVPDQRRIAGILSAYDDLIENNTRRIEILEEMAQAIYREWFVSFRFPSHEKVRLVDSPLGPTPEGWRTVTLKDIVEQRHASAKSGEHLRDRRYVPIECIPRRSLTLLEARPWQEAQSSLQLFEKGDIVFGAMRPYFHKVVVAPFKGVTRTTCFVLRPKHESLLPFALLTLFQDDSIRFATAHAQGTTIPYTVWENSFCELPVLLPPEQIYVRFAEIITPIVGVLQSAYLRMSNLRQTRDLLLPKLISGEVDVSELDIDVGGSET